MRKNVPDVTTNASPPRRDILSGSSMGSSRNNMKKAPETRDRPNHPPVDYNSFAPSTDEPTRSNNPVNIAPAGNANDDDDLDFLEAEINNYGASSVNNVIANRGSAAKPPKA